MTISAADRAKSLLNAHSPSTQRTREGEGTAATQDLASGRFIKSAVIAGGSAGNLTVTGIKTTDTLASVLKIPGAGTAVTDIADLTSEFQISATNTINNTSGTTTASSKVLVLWIARS